ncbi:MAG: hypothetical protein HYY02_09655 [Chloroflexi bacterium]|nr:hypothetical protein [Chloroflexota bacterium]
MPAALSGPFRYARTCYRHPAGQVGVAITDWLLDLAWVLPTGGGYRLTNTGLVSLDALGAPGDRLRTDRAYSFCTDYTERRHHLSGDLGAALTQWLFAREWAIRAPEGGRLLQLTDAGRVALTGLRVKLP